MITAIMGVRQVGVSLSDWLGIIAAGLTVLGILIGFIGMYFHWAVVNAGPRRKWIERLQSPLWRDSYHDLLRSALDWLDRRIGPPPFASYDLAERRVVGMSSLGVCVTLSLTYSIGSWMAGWVAGAPGALGQPMLEAQWAASWGPVWLPRTVGVLAFLAMTIFYVWLYVSVIGTSARSKDKRSFSFLMRILLGKVGEPYGLPLFLIAIYGTASFMIYIIIVQEIADWIFPERFVHVMLLVMFASSGAFSVTLIIWTSNRSMSIALAGTLASAAFMMVAIFFALPSKAILILTLFSALLPWLNGILDWISLSVSRWFGRVIVAERDSPASLAITVGLALADLILAVAFAFAVAWVLAFAVEAAGLWVGLPLELDAYVRAAADAPWTTGFWATFMILSTLIPSAIHLVLALGAVLVAWSGNPLRAWAAGKLKSANEADWLGPQLYLTLGWLVPAVAAPLLLLGLIAQLVGFIEPLPQALADTALHAIATASGSFGP